MDERDLEVIAGGPPMLSEADALRAIVERHRRGRVRVLGVALALVLVGGPAAGWAAGRAGRRGGQTVAAGSPTSAIGANGGEAAVSAEAALALGGASVDPLAVLASAPSAPSSKPTARRLFIRTTSDGISVRAYLGTLPKFEPCARTEAQTPPKGTSGPPTASPNSGSTGGAGKPPNSAAPATAACQCITVGGSSGASAGASVASGASASGSSGGAASPPAGGSASGPPSAGRGSSPQQVGPPTPGPCPLPNPACSPTSMFIAELSNQAAVGQGSVPIFGTAGSSSEALTELHLGTFGAIEGSPAVWVAVHAGSGVAKVRLVLDTSTVDEMAPIEGWVVLAHPLSNPMPKAATVQALDGSGKVDASLDLRKDRSRPSFPAECVKPVPVPLQPPSGQSAPAAPGKVAPATTTTAR